MTIAEDTEWLRARLQSPGFHRDYPQQWIAIRDEKVTHSDLSREALQSWLEANDKERQCVLAFTDDRPLV
jgi:hypothetical protein